MIYSDVRLLNIFDQLYKTRSVHRAAEALGLTQPAVSIALGKLRRHFGDELFVRTGKGMEPTRLAEELVEPFRHALASLEAAFGYRNVFNPETSDRSFHLCMSDITQVGVLPRLWTHLSVVAPGISVEVLPRGDAETTARLLETGAADIAIGFIPQLGSGFYQQVLFRQDYVVIASASHPRIREALTIEHLKNESHAVITTVGTGYEIIDDEFARQGIRRRVALTLPSFLGAALIIERTSLLLVIPRGLAETLDAQRNFRSFPLPFRIPEFSVKQHWHERSHRDSGNQWLRARIAELISAPQ